MRSAAFVAGAAFLLGACGSRTGLSGVTAGAPPDAGANDAPSMEEAGDGPGADVADARDANEDREEASPCGSPWVLFTLLFESEGGAFRSTRIYARRADGTEGHALTLPSPQAANPSVSPDGTALLYTDQTLSMLYLYRFADAESEKLDTQGGVGFGSLSPDGRIVVFGDGQNLFVVGVDGGTEQPLVSDTTGNAAGSPSFTPDSGSVVYGVANEVRSIRLSDYVWHTLIHDPASGVMGLFPDPAFSPDYAQLVAVVGCGGARALRAYSTASLPAPCASGRVVTTLTDQASSPAWGPSGLIAYADGKDVQLVSAGGGAPANLTADLTTPSTPASGPTWAPACTVLP